MYVYINSDVGMWTVGHYDPATKEWVAEGDYDSPEQAADRVAWLNGSGLSWIAVSRLRRMCDRLQVRIED